MPVATISLLVANLLIFALTVSPLLEIRPEVADAFALSRSNASLVTLITHLFLHQNVLHVLGNMWFLYIFGFAVEGRLRAGRFLAIYFGSGIFASLLQLWIFGGSGAYLAGASGAIMGVLGAALYLFPHGQVQFIWGFGPSRWQMSTWNMMFVAAYYLGLDLLFIFLGGFTSGVAHLAHIAGAAIGFGICYAFRPTRDTRQASEAKAMLTETKELSMLSSSELSAMARVNPNDTGLILAWMQRNIRDGNVRKDCSDAFLRLLPRIIEVEQGPSVGFVLVALLAIDTPIRSVHLLKVARSLEAADEGTMARRLYESVLRNSKSSSADIQAALFRLALIHEGMNQTKEAALTYGELLERYPMSPMAGQARMRLDNLPLYR